MSAQTRPDPRSYGICTTSPAWSTCTRRTRMGPAPCRRSRVPRRAQRPMSYSSPTTTRSRQGGAVRRAGTATSCVLAGEEVSPLGKNHYLAFGVDERDPPPRPRRVRDRTGGPRRRRVRLRRAPVLGGVRTLQAPRHAVRRARLRRPARNRAVELRQRHRRAHRKHPRADPVPGRARTHARPPARAQHAPLGRTLPRRGAWWRSAASMRTSSGSGSARWCPCG